jgi:DNA replication and repair protein RecF
MMGHVTCVIFSPEDLDLIKGGPSCRRRFMDMLLCQQSAAYFYELQKYIASLSQRNALLRSVKGNAGHSAVKMLPVWEEQLQKAGAMIIETRMVFAEALEKLVTEHYRYLCGPDREAIVLRYRASTDKKADIKAALSEGFDKTRAEDIKRGITTFGPHREDIILALEGRDMRTFASQGQIRAAALSMKLSEISLLTRKHAEAPILLLDDVMSELDMKRRALLMDFIKGIQTIVTCTDASDFPEGKTDMRLHVVAAKNGGATLETV